MPLGFGGFMDKVNVIDEIINEVYVCVKETFSFFELDDIEIYKLIKKCIGKNKEVTKELLLKKVNNYFSKEIFKQVLNNDYKKLDNFFENEFVCWLNKYGNYETLEKLCDVMGNPGSKIVNDLYVKLFERYDVLSRLLMDVTEDTDCLVSIDKRVQKLFRVYLEFCGCDTLDKDSMSGLEECVSDMDIIRDYYLYNDTNALEKFIEINMPLVRSVAKKYKWQGLSYDDLVQEGVIGFLKAIEKFDISSNAKLSSYAYPSIERHIARAINSDSRDIRIPDWRCEELKKYVLAKRDFINCRGVNPTVEEMASLMNISIEKVEESELLSSNYICSLNLKIDDENDTEFGDLIKDTKFSSPEDCAIENFMRDDINLILEEVLTDQEKAIINLSFGRYDGVVRNNAEVGEAIYEYGLYHKPLTRERVRQLKSGAIKKLQDSSYVKKLESYL